jgi:aromatic-L-amino-acid/L-tryptophan decarboxylase
MTPAEFRSVAHAAVDLMAEYLERLPAGPVFTPFPPELARAFEAAPVPIAGASAGEVLADFERWVAPYPFGNGHPRFYGWVNSPPHPLGIVADALAATMNPSVAGGNHAAVHVEHQVIRWFSELAGWGPGGTGLTVSGGSDATLTALAVARQRAVSRAGLEVRRKGLGDGPRLSVYIGPDTHTCARKAVELLGLGSDAITVVAADAERRIRPDALRAAMLDDRAAGRVPMAAVATVGTANTGAVDPVDAIVDVCEEAGVWSHVDGAYGGVAALLLDGYPAVRAGMARADSIALDPHKWLGAPVDVGLVLLRDASAARDCFSLVPPYLRTDGDQGGVTGPVWFSEFGFDQTRPFRALKVWLLLKHLGLDGYRTRLAHDLAMADRLAQQVAVVPDLELLARGLSIVCFRVRPVPGIEPDRHNEAVLRAVQLGGRAFVSGTTVDGATALRACVINGTTEDDIDALVDTVRTTSRSLRSTRSLKEQR